MKFKSIGLLFSILISCFLSVFNAHADDSVGYVGGEFSVDEVGVASYSVPIDLPPGVDSVQPRLSLSFGSSNRNGELGVGGFLSGLSEIHRCGTNLINDGFVDPVDYDENDQFCIDGNRLVLTDAGYYVDADNQITKAIPHGNTATLNGGWEPDYWEVHSQNGLVQYFGLTSSASDVGAAVIGDEVSGNVFSWRIAETVDAFGNSVHYYYHQKSDKGATGIDRIAYGPNGRFSIKFNWEARDDVKSLNSPGLRFLIQLLRINSVDVLVDDQSIRRYLISYDAATNFESLAKSLSVCSVSNCLTEVLFNWHESELTAGDITSGPPTTINDSEDGANRDIKRIKIGDFNGDGITDIYRINGWGSSSEDYVYLFNRDGGHVRVLGPKTTIGGVSSTANRDINRIHLGDFNGDGITDVYRINGWNSSSPDSVYLFDSAGASREVAGPPTLVGGTDDTANRDINRVMFGDFNGDGITDVYRVNGWGGSSADSVYLFHSDGTYTTKVGPSTLVGGDSNTANRDINRIKLADFNGDGITDVYRVNGWGSSSDDDVYLFNSAGEFTPVPGPPTYVGSVESTANRDISRVKLGDFNGDGITDVYRINGWGSSSPDSVYLFQSDGGFLPISGPPTPINDSEDGANRDIRRVNFGDFNGDGITDVYRVNGWGSSSADSVYLFDADGGYRPVTGPKTTVDDSSSGANRDIRRLKFADFNGDGITDVYRINGWGKSSADSVHLFRADGGYDTISGPATYVGDVSSTANRDINRVQFGDFNGDGILDVYRINGWGNSSPDTVWLRSASRELRSINDGQKEIIVNYTRLTNSSAYQRGEDSSYPDINVVPLHKVVTRVDVIGDGQATSSQTYDYTGYMAHVGGYGQLGFKTVTVLDVLTGISTVTTYSQDWVNRTVGMVETTQTISPSGVVLSEAVNQLANRFDGIYTDRFLPYIQSTTSIQRDLDGSVINMTTLENYLNDDGVVVQDVTCTTDSDSFTGEIVPCDIMPGKAVHKTSSYDYYPKEYAPDFRALLQRKTTTISIPDAPPFQPAAESRVVAYEYYPATGKVKSETIQPDDSNLWLKKEYAYHASGQLATTTVSGADVAPRSVEVVYDPVTLMPIRKYNELRHVEEIEYQDSRFPWLATKVTAPDGSWAKATYNGWGEKVRTESGYGAVVFYWAVTDKRWCLGDAVCDEAAGEVFYVVSEASVGAPSYVFFDRLGREVRRQNSGLKDGVVTNIFARTEYDARGRVVWAGNPYFESDSTEYGVTTEYDLLGRVTKITDADQQESTVEYHGRTVIYTDPKGHKKTVVKNALGQQVSVLDNRDNAITYRYDAFGNMVYMSDPFGNETKIGFDSRGFKTRLSDPDQGEWYYTYNSLGQMIDQIDAKGQITRTGYDLLGRVVNRTDLFGTPQASTSTWTYGELGGPRTELGKLKTVTNNRNYSQTINYDNYGRARDTVTVIDGQTYTNQVTYDNYGRVLDTTYPNGYTIQNRYHPVLGGLESIVNPDGDADPTNDYTFWKAISTDARGQLERASLGGIITTSSRHNAATGMVEDIRATASWMSSFVYQDVSYRWDAVGNLESFNDLRQGVAETYVYDDLYRLNDVVASNGINLSTRYDDIGNIVSKSGVGTYAYDTVAVPAECGAGTGASGPHAVRRITGEKANYYCYDANGNLVRDKDRQIRYTAFNKPDRIARGSTVVNFDYGPDRSRFKRVEVKGGSTETTIYLGGYEKVTEGGVVKHKISVGGVALVTQTQGQSIIDIDYLLKDHIGSITAIVNKYGTVKEEMSFDAWGNRRLTNLDLQANPLDYRNNITKRGFTGHEHIDSVGLIHMNGRVYDPVIGRFLSADPIVQAPSNLQSLNRYSYVLNNPLSMIDPTGYSWWGKKKNIIKRVAMAAVGAVVGAVVGAAVGFTVGCTAGPLGCIAGAVAGAKYGAMAGASYGYSYQYGRDKGLSRSDAFKLGAKSAAITLAGAYGAGVAGDFLAGIDYAAMYGNAAVAEGITRVAVHSILGGTLSKLGGGSFADGAVTGGFRAFYSFGMFRYLDRHSFFSFDRVPALAMLEQGAVSAAAAKVRGMDSSAAFNQVIINSLMAFLFNDQGSHSGKTLRQKALDGDGFCNGDECISFGTREVWHLTDEANMVVRWEELSDDGWYEYAAAGPKIPVAGISVEGQMQLGEALYKHQKFVEYYMVKTRGLGVVYEGVFEREPVRSFSYRTLSVDTKIRQRMQYRVCSSVGTVSGCVNF